MRNVLQSTYSVIFPAIIGAGLGILSGHINLSIGLVSILLGLHIINRHRPSSKFARLENATKKAEDLLVHAEESCLMHWHGDVVELKVRLFRAKLAAANIEAEFMTQKMRKSTAFLPLLSQTLSSKTRLSEALRQIPRSSKEYVQKMWRLTQRIKRCAHEVKEIEKSIRILSMNERGRLILQGVREVEAIAISGCVRRRVGESSSASITSESINGSILQTDTAFEWVKDSGDFLKGKTQCVASGQRRPPPATVLEPHNGQCNLLDAKSTKHQRDRAEPCRSTITRRISLNFARWRQLR
ncbi:hypothetical protein R3P38DRAFT_3501007 [Favolaschia claudopus]|uniref:ATP synthase protein MI25 n=1 Tax=Favolaschia claudopus TaxID=2862362 RepID=A0AAV9Z3E8_9AGAR